MSSPVGTPRDPRDRRELARSTRRTTRMATRRAQFDAGGMACWFCAEGIHKAYERTEGVEDVDVSLTHEGVPRRVRRPRRRRDDRARASGLRDDRDSAFGVRRLREQLRGQLLPGEGVNADFAVERRRSRRGRSRVADRFISRREVRTYVTDGETRVARGADLFGRRTEHDYPHVRHSRRRAVFPEGASAHVVQGRPGHDRGRRGRPGEPRDRGRPRPAGAVRRRGAPDGRSPRPRRRSDSGHDASSTGTAVRSLRTAAGTSSSGTTVARRRSDS